MNNEFLSEAFDADERSSILVSKISNNVTNYWKTNSENDTSDYVFLLSIREYDNYRESFRTSSEVLSTLYTDGLGFWNANSPSIWYWTRSSGKNQTESGYVIKPGYSRSWGYGVHNYGGIRPAFWLEINESASITVIPSATPEPTAKPVGTLGPNQEYTLAFISEDLTSNTKAHAYNFSTQGTRLLKSMGANL